MFTTNRSIVLIVLMLFSTLALAQEYEQYEGTYQHVSGEEGNARFRYYQPKKSDEKILDGDFFFEVTRRDSAAQNVLIKKVYNGAYRENEKHGPWNYDLKRYEVVLKDIENLEVVYDLNGAYLNIKGKYEEGVPVGEWVFREDMMQDGEYVKTIRRGIANFSDGTLTGAFTFHNNLEGETYTVKGQFDEDGLMDQQWELQYPLDSLPVEEIRTYQHGFLTSIVRFNRENDKVLDSLIYDDVLANLQALDSAKAKALDFEVSDAAFGIFFDHGYRAGTAARTRQSQGNRVIGEALSQFNSVGDPLAISQPRKLLRLTRRFAYDISKQEKAAIKRLTLAVDSLKADINPLVTNEVLELNRQRNDSLAFVYQYFGELQNQLKRLDTIAAYLQTDAYRYTNPQIYFSKALDFVRKTDTLYYNVDGEAQTHLVRLPETPAYDTNSFPLQLSQYVQDVRQYTQPLIAFVYEELNTIEQEGINQALEEKISRKVKQVKQLYGQQSDSVPADSLLNPLQVSAYERFMNGKVNQLERQYSQCGDLIKKQKIGNNIYAVLDTLEAAYSYLDTIPQLVQRVDQAYTEKTFDPYTFSYDFTRRIKKELYEKAAVHLYQHLLSELYLEEDYQRFLSRAREIVQLHERLLELTEEKTRSMERRLRNTDDPQEIKSIIGLA